MAIITFMAAGTLVAILLLKLTLEQQRAHQADEKTEMQDEDKGKETKVPSSDLGQPSCQLEPSEIHNPPNLPPECPQNLQVRLAEEVGRANQMTTEQDMGMVARLALQSLNLQHVTAAEGPVDKTKKIGVKVACLVISVSTTAIISFLAGVPRSHSSLTSKLIFKSVILSMFASLFSALVLLVLSTNNGIVSCSDQTLRIIIWVSMGPMTLALVLLLTFYIMQT